MNEIKKIVEKYHSVNFDYVEERPGEVMTTKANTLPLSKLGWSHSISIVDGINKCFNFRRNK